MREFNKRFILIVNEKPPSPLARNMNLFAIRRHPEMLYVISKVSAIELDNTYKKQ